MLFGYSYFANCIQMLKFIIKSIRYMMLLYIYIYIYIVIIYHKNTSLEIVEKTTVNIKAERQDITGKYVIYYHKKIIFILVFDNYILLY